MSDVCYWLTNPLAYDDTEVLERIQAGTQRFADDRLIVAYLIARECVRANLRRKTLKLTPKGKDALSFYAGRRRGPLDKADRE